MDFSIAIATDGSAAGQMTFDAPPNDNNLLNNAWLSLEVPRGSWFQDPAFGSRLGELRRRKNSATTARDAVDYCKEALQWLLDTGRATEVDVITEPDMQDPYRLNALVTIYGPGDQVVSFKIFVGVV